MNQFVKTDEGILNLAFVQRIEVGFTKTDGKISRFRLFYGPDDKFLGRATRGKMCPVMDGMDAHDIDAATAPIVAANAGDYAVEIYVDMENGRPTVENVWVDRPRIVAWRILDSQATPIFAERMGDGSVLIPDPCGALRLPDDQVFDDLDHARACILERAQEHWDAAHKQAAP